MKAEDFFEKQMANIRELWHLSDLQKKMVYILMEEYAALHIADVVGRSEPLTPKYTPCGGCGADNPNDRCINCFHDFGGN